MQVLVFERCHDEVTPTFLTANGSRFKLYSGIFICGILRVDYGYADAYRALLSTSSRKQHGAESDNDPTSTPDFTTATATDRPER